MRRHVTTCSRKPKPRCELWASRAGAVISPYAKRATAKASLRARREPSAEQTPIGWKVVGAHNGGSVSHGVTAFAACAPAGP
jgi:hypothetical protein